METKPRSKTEILSIEETNREISELCEKLQKKESEFWHSARNQVSILLSSIEKPRFGKWLSRIMLAIKLLESSTALAQTPEKPPIPAVKADEEKLVKAPQITKSAQWILEKFFEEQNNLKEPIVATSSYSDSYHQHSLDNKSLAERKPIIAKGEIKLLELKRLLPLAVAEEERREFEIGAQQNSGGSTFLKNRLEKSEFIHYFFRDGFGNHITANLEFIDGKDQVLESISISPAHPDFTQNNDRRAVNFDLKEIGLGMVIGAFYDSPPISPLIGKAGEIPIYLANKDSMFKEHAPRQAEWIAPELERGINEASALFSDSPNSARRIVLVTRNERNAYAIYDQNEIQLSLPYLFSYDFDAGFIPDSDIMRWQSVKEVTADTASHEMLHLLTHKYGLVADLEIQKFYYSHPRSQLERFSENRFYETWGGHASDTPDEMITSYLNCLRRADWERRVREDDRGIIEQHQAMLTTISGALDRSRNLPLKAPIRSLVAERLAFVDSFIAKTNVNSDSLTNQQK